jgi:hypothetical protein
MTSTETSQIEIIDLGNYDILPISELLSPLVMLGIVTNATDPQKLMATMEAFNKQAVLTVPVFQGEQGDPGSDALSLKFRNDGKTAPDELPTDLGDYNSDLGKFWVFAVRDPTTGDAIATTIYVWTGVDGGLYAGYPGLGQGFVQLPVGTPGPDGQYADIAPQLSLTTPGTGLGPDDTDSWVATNDGSVQFLTLTGTPTSGQFQVIVKIGGVSVTSNPITYSEITAATILSTLTAMSNIGAGNVIVSEQDSVFTILFSGTLDSEGIDLMVITGSTLVGGSVAIAEPTLEDPEQVFYLAVPDGIRGPAAALGARYDVDLLSNPPTNGDQLQCSDRVTPGPPTGLNSSVLTTNGTLSGHVYYVVTATTPNGESLPSNEVSVSLSGSTNCVELTWTVPSGNGATGFNVYRGTTAGEENRLVAVIVSGTRTSFIDTGVVGNAAALPTESTPVGVPMWVPYTPEPSYPLLYTVPESAFHSAIGLEFLNVQTTVGTFALPQQEFPWVPFVFGELKVSGLSLSLAPLMVAAEVMIGDPSTGQEVAFGTGNSLGTLVLTSSFGATEYAPGFTNSWVPVPANHTGNQGTLYVKLVNTGLISLDVFSSDGAQLSVLVCPVAED